MFLSIKIRFSFSDVALIFGGPLQDRVTSKKKYQGKILNNKATEFEDVPSLLVTSIKRNYSALLSSLSLVDI